jgi:hypothetical protein
MTDSLSSGRMLVTWILTGAIMPVEMDARVVRRHPLNAADMATGWKW